jgi:hypothetical protein
MSRITGDSPYVASRIQVHGSFESIARLASVLSLANQIAGSKPRKGPGWGNEAKLPRSHTEQARIFPISVYSMDFKRGVSGSTAYPFVAPWSAQRAHEGRPSYCLALKTKHITHIV